LRFFRLDPSRERYKRKGPRELKSEEHVPNPQSKHTYTLLNLRDTKKGRRGRIYSGDKKSRGGEGKKTLVFDCLFWQGKSDLSGL